jgi:peptidyl-prolyl cis-trans isomerase D
MQKNNKFLIITIWIATISFIFTGATYGFKYGIKSSSIGEVGDIELSRDKFQMEYRNLYNRYNQAFQGKFDEEQAKQMHLQDQVLNNMAVQAMILNLAKDFGIVVSNKEVADNLATIPTFQKDGIFNRGIYSNFLKNSGLSAKTFESNLKENLTIQKTFSMMNLKALKEEYKAFEIAFETADKIKYITLSYNDMNVSIDEAKLKEFWEARKEQFQTSKQYSFDIVWTQTKDVNVTDDEVEKFFNENSFKYTTPDGKLLTFEDAKKRVTKDLKIKKSKKSANKKYIAYKKNEIKKDETLSYDLGDYLLSKEIWDEVNSKNIGDLLKPKIVGDRYAIMKIVDIKEPVVKSFEEAKALVTSQYKSNLAKELLAKESENRLKNIDSQKTEISDFITLKNTEEQKMGLNKQETADFTTKLFTSDQEKGIISIGDKVVVYKIIEQKLVSLDKNETEGLYQNVDKLKEQSFESNIIKQLDKKYPTKFYK